MLVSLAAVLLRLDAAAFHWVVAHRWPPLDYPMIALSHAGAWVWVTLAAVLAVAFRRSGAFAGACQSAIAIGLAALLANPLAKPFLGRQRPYLVFKAINVLIDLPKSASFPSGHAAASFAGAYALSRLFPELKIPIWLLACLVALSRVYVGVHYPLDVISGALLGLASAAFVVGGSRWYSEQLAAGHVSRADVAR